MNFDIFNAEYRTKLQDLYEKKIKSGIKVSEVEKYILQMIEETVSADLQYMRGFLWVKIYAKKDREGNIL